MTCQDRETLARYASGELPAEQAAEVRAHLQECPTCAAAAAAQPAASPTPDGPATSVDVGGFAMPGAVVAPAAYAAPPPPPTAAVGDSGSESGFSGHAPWEGPCPSREELRAYLTGAMAPERRAEVRDHVANCDECFEVMRDLRQETEDASRPARPAAAGTVAAAPVALPASVVEATPAGIPPLRQVLSHAAIAAAAAAVAVTLYAPTQRAESQPNPRQAAGPSMGLRGGQGPRGPGAGGFGAGRGGPGFQGGMPGGPGEMPGGPGGFTPPTQPSTAGIATFPGGPPGGPGGMRGGPGGMPGMTGTLNAGPGPGVIPPAGGSSGGGSGMPGPFAGRPGMAPGAMPGGPGGFRPPGMIPGGPGFRMGSGGPMPGSGGPVPGSGGMLRPAPGGTGGAPQPPAAPPVTLEAVLPIRQKPTGAAAGADALRATPAATQKALKQAADAAEKSGPAAGVKILESFIEKPENQDPEVYLLLSTFYLKLGDREHAAKSLAEASERLNAAETQPPAGEPGTGGNPVAPAAPGRG